MRKTLAYLLFSIFFISCSNPSNKKIETTYSDNVTAVESDDLNMNVAIVKAKGSFRDFDTAFKNGHFDTSEFSIKVRFDVDAGGEHIWTNSIRFENGHYYGTVNEDAEATDKVKQGDRVRITTDNLSDWMYNDNGVLRGGYTIKVLRNKMTPGERASFDSSFYLRIID
ncbi:MAG: DUF2314 domain-containing protein [Lacibacter sp.]